MSLGHGVGQKRVSNQQKWQLDRGSHILTASGNSGLAKQHHPYHQINVVTLMPWQHPCLGS